VFGGRPPAPRDRTARFAEFAELTDLLLRQPETDWTGRYYAARGAVMRPGCVQRPRGPTSLRRIVVVGTQIVGVLTSASVFAEARDLFASLGFTDMVVFWPRPEDPGYTVRLALSHFRW
jgi:hypothetical protein